jgi:hypothetical protein
MDRRKYKAIGRMAARQHDPLTEARSNNKMEPTRLTVRAIMALRRAAHFERSASK